TRNLARKGRNAWKGLSLNLTGDLRAGKRQPGNLTRETRITRVRLRRRLTGIGLAGIRLAGIRLAWHRLAGKRRDPADWLAGLERLPVRANCRLRPSFAGTAAGQGRIDILLPRGWFGSERRLHADVRVGVR